MPETEAAAGGERRQSQRHLTMLQVAKFTTDEGEELCLIRNISSGGVQIQTYRPVRQDERIAISLRAGYVLHGRVAWVAGSKSGVQFDTPIDVQEVLAGRIGAADSLRVRSPRLAADFWATMEIDDQVHHVHVCDVSQGGIKIDSDEKFRPGTRTWVHISQFGRREAVVRWCRSGQAGLAFLTPISYVDFAGWRQRAAANC
jgi:hypothetical protein